MIKSDLNQSNLALGQIPSPSICCLPLPSIPCSCYLYKLSGEAQSSSFHPKCASFQWLMQALFYSQLNKASAVLELPYCTRYLHFCSHLEAPELTNLKPLNACGKRNISFFCYFFIWSSIHAGASKTLLGTFSLARAW